MKNIIDILKTNGIELTDEQVSKVNEMVKENYKTINDYENQKGKLELAENKVKEIETTFETFKKGFEGVDVEALKGKVTELETNLATVTKEHQTKLSRMALDTMLSEIAKDKGCVDFDLAKTQFNYDELLVSKNQKEDVEKVFDGLKQAKPILFKNEQEPIKKGVVIGGVGEEPKPTVTFKSFI